MFIIQDMFGNEFEFGSIAPYIIHSPDGKPIDVNRDPILQSMIKSDLVGSRLIKYIPQSEETDIIIPDGVIEIFAFAFENCTTISSIQIPSSVRKIDAYAFVGCTSLAKVEFLSNATEVDDTAFVGCESLKNEDGLVIVNGILFDCFSNSALVEIPSSVHSIGTCAFNDCDNLREISIPPSVNEVNCGAFRGCTGLADKNGFIVVRNVIHDCINKSIHIVLPYGVKAVNGIALANCSKECVSLAFPGSIDEVSLMTTLGGRWSKLESIAFSDGIRKIAMSFNRCSNLQSVIIPQSVTAIENSFSECPNLTIHAPVGSYAIEWAKQNNARYIEY